MSEGREWATWGSGLKASQAKGRASAKALKQVELGICEGRPVWLGRCRKGWGLSWRNRRGRSLALKGLHFLPHVLGSHWVSQQRNDIWSTLLTWGFVFFHGSSEMIWPRREHGFHCREDSLAHSKEEAILGDGKYVCGDEAEVSKLCKSAFPKVARVHTISRCGNKLYKIKSWVRPGNTLFRKGNPASFLEVSSETSVCSVTPGLFQTRLELAGFPNWFDHRILHFTQCWETPVWRCQLKTS